MKRILFFSLFLFLLLPGLAGAWEDTVERYPTGVYTDYWTWGYTSVYWGSVGGSAQIAPYANPTTSALCLNSWVSGAGTSRAQSNSYITLKTGVSPSYISFVLRDGPDGVTGYGPVSEYSTTRGLRIDILTEAGASLCYYATVQTYDNTKYEIIRSGSYYDFYENGVFKASKALSGGYDGNIRLKITNAAFCLQNQYVSTNVYLDDFSTSSSVGLPEVLSEGADNFTCTWTAQLKRSYSEQYYLKLYSITNSNNAGLLESYSLPESGEHGFISTSRNNLLSTNFGLYKLDLTRESDILASSYFWYDSLSNPIGYPELLFLAGSNAEAEITDQDLNGGTITGGGSVYLYPSENNDGIYNFTYDILEAPYSLEATLTTVYNTSTINQTNFLFTGLSTQSYYVSVDGEEIESTNNLDTWEYQINNSSANHVFNFDLDYRAPGVWGYIKNSETQSPIKSATVTISNSSNTYYLFTDSNGMYYKTRDMISGSYNVSAAKSGYTASVPYNVPTQENLTSRQDIFLDPIQGSGVYYASHDVTFTVLEYWYSSVGLPGVSYAVYDDENESVKNGTTGSKGTFSVKDMDAEKNYTFILTHNGATYTEYLEPGLTEYTLVLNKEGIVHQYYNSWLNLTYAENSNNVTVLYDSNKTVTEASFTITASNGSQVQADTLNTTSGTFTFDFTEGDYILQFNIEASDGSTAAQAWSISSPPEVTLFPASYPTWLKNTLFTAIIIIFLLAFGKSKNDIACGAVAVLTSLGYYFEWLTCSFNFVVLIWIIALGAIFLHYKRTGAVG